MKRPLSAISRLADARVLNIRLAPEADILKRSGFDPNGHLAVGRGTVCKGLVDPMGLVKWPSYLRAAFAFTRM
jgi:hypothetical protein